MGYLEIFGNNKVAISDKLFNNKNVKYVSIFHMTDDGFGNKHETEGKITFVLNDIQGEKKFNGEGRVLIRPSGTEPLVRVMIEGKDQKVIDEEAKKLAELITNTML